jgi:hypothetical protein
VRLQAARFICFRSWTIMRMSWRTLFLDMRFTLLHVSLLWSGVSLAQTFPDTVMTTARDTIVCRITFVNEYSIFLQTATRNKLTKRDQILRSHVAEIRLHSAVDVPPELLMPDEAPMPGWSENNGVIYPSDLSEAPRFGNGQIDLFHYLEQHVHLSPSDSRMYGDGATTLVYKVDIDSVGNVREVVMHDMLYGPLDHEPRARFLQEQIGRVLSQMPPWSPARHTDRPVDTVFYIPVSFTVLFDKLQMQASKYRLVFKHRDP